MAPTTRSRAAPVPSRATKRAAQDLSDEDSDNANAQEHKPATKRAKTTHDKANAKRAPPRRSTAQKTNPNITRGGLKALPTMPLDVLEEIFCTLDPASLVNISRTTKSFRQLLLSPAYEHVWREAFSRDETGIPQPPDGMRAKHWALLLFGGDTCEHCHKQNAPEILFYLRIRLCEACISSTLHRPSSTSFRGISIQQLIPAEFVEKVISERRTQYGYGRQCSLTCYAFGEKYHPFVAGQKAALAKGPDEELRYVEEHRDAFTARYVHAKMATKWQRDLLAAQKKERERRQREISDAKNARKREIEKRLEDLDYNTYDKKIMSGVWKLKGINIAQPLTDEEWKELWPAIRGVIDGNRAKKNSEAAAKRRDFRIRHVGSHYDRMLHDPSCVQPQEVQYFPRTNRCLEFEPLKSFVEEDAPDRYRLGWDDTTQLDLTLRQTILGMRQVQDEQYLKLYNLLLTGGYISKNTKQEKALSLAIAIFRLGRDWSNELRFGREAMSHDRKDYRQRYQSLYEDSPVTVSSEGVGAVRMLLGLLGMKHDSTIEDMDLADAHFVCVSCKPRSAWLDLKKAGESHRISDRHHVATREVFSWRRAVGHVHDEHKETAADVRIRLLTKREQAALEAKYHEKYKVTHTAPICFGCCHCHDYGDDASQHAQGRHDGLLSKRDVVKHLQKKHSIPTKKITENVDFWYHSCFSRGLLDSSITSFNLVED
ncbi:unnamed protein product [Peniophora sp. CBMAI 1063]|nr:unnamed protein product [Peniophora sp. CBMAI 1063]